MNASHRTLAVDWSGAKAYAERKIWLCEVAGGEVRRLECGRTRAGIADHLLAEAYRDPRFVVGLDFAFSFPAPLLDKRGHRRVESVWQEAELLGEKWLEHCPSPPFWGKPGKRKPALGEALHRATELRLAAETGLRPLSVFQIGGAGAVGVGSIRGMPILRRLRDAGFSIWPFHEPDWPRVVEIWPRVFQGGGVRKSVAADRERLLAERYPNLPAEVRAEAETSDDAFDALVSALEMDRHRQELAELGRAVDRLTRLEGAIWRPSTG